MEERYPNGFIGHTIRLKNSSNEPYFGVPLETEDTYYIVKVNPNEAKDKKTEEHDEFSSPHEHDYDNHSGVSSIEREYLQDIHIPIEIEKDDEKKYYDKGDTDDDDDDVVGFKKFKPLYDTED
ncbi:MAG: hypothetical protein QM536_03785 [Chitinophagaceae bacterium]|nr:hypothetical protein [Chitinophagaceae bacterium]